MGRVVLLAYVALLAPVLAHGQSITLYPFQTDGGSLRDGLTSGPDGNLWYTAFEGIGRFSPENPTETTVFPIPGVAARACDIIAGPDGNLWFTEFNGSLIGRITPEGVIREFGASAGLNSPCHITVGPDGALWFSMASALGRITTAGGIQTFTIPFANSRPFSLIVGPDDNFWYEEGLVGKLGKTTSVSPYTSFRFDVKATAISGFGRQLVSGSDGMIWFSVAQSIARVDPSDPEGTYSKVDLPTGGAADEVALGPDGNVWFLDATYGLIGRITTDGSITEFAPPEPIAVQSITSGPDGHLWLLTGVGAASVDLDGPPAPTPTDRGTPTQTGTPTNTRTPRPTRTAAPTLTKQSTRTPTGMPGATVTHTPTTGPSAALGMALSADGAVLAVDDLGAFPDAGVVVIDGEHISYSGRQPLGAGTAAGEGTTGQPGLLLNLRRGVDGTAPAAHASGATVTLVHAAPTCVGDCAGVGAVATADILHGVEIVLGLLPPTACPALDCAGLPVTVECLVQGVRNAVSHCPS